MTATLDDVQRQGIGRFVGTIFIKLRHLTGIHRATVIREIKHQRLLLFNAMQVEVVLHAHFRDAVHDKDEGFFSNEAKLHHFLAVSTVATAYFFHKGSYEISVLDVIRYFQFHKWMYLNFNLFFKPWISSQEKQDGYATSCQQNDCHVLEDGYRTHAQMIEALSRQHPQPRQGLVKEIV